MKAGAAEREIDLAGLDSFIFNPPGQPRDLRLTGIGVALRATSVDELPQLLNVLRGEMNLVGPRPELPLIVQKYRPEYHRRHMVAPGITGLAQVTGRSDLPYRQIIARDLDYIRRRSRRLDLRILERTIGVVTRSDGAR